MTKRTIILLDAARRQRAKQAIDEAPEGYAVTISEPTRSLDQNARLWACLTEISRQVVWHGKKLDPEAWKIVFSSAIRKLDVVPNLDGTGFVALGNSTSRMSKREFADMLALIDAFAAERGVVLQDGAAA